MLWFEQPGIDRGVVLPVGPSTRAEVVQGLLAALDGGEIFRAVTVDDLFAAASPLRQPGGGLVDRTLVPERPPAIDRSVAGGLRSARALLASYEGMLGPDSPRAEPVASQLLLSTAAELDDADQRAHLAVARSAIDAVVSAISTPKRETITLTARDGTIPLTVRNDAGVPVHVVVHLHSSKLEFPSGDTVSLTLSEATTRLDIDVRARASGSFPLEVEVTSPDGSITLATIDFTVQSTAVSGVGVVLSVGRRTVPHGVVGEALEADAPQRQARRDNPSGDTRPRSRFAVAHHHPGSTGTWPSASSPTAAATSPTRRSPPTASRWCPSRSASGTRSSRTAPS